MSKIVVAGSSNIDMTAYVKSLPRPGETIGGGRFMQANGGKGANQAVAAGRLGGDVLFMTCVGDDMQGRMLTSRNLRPSYKCDLWRRKVWHLLLVHRQGGF